jgi:hypothetical protein
MRVWWLGQSISLIYYILARWLGLEASMKRNGGKHTEEPALQLGRGFSPIYLEHWLNLETSTRRYYVEHTESVLQKVIGNAGKKTSFYR